MNTSQCLGFLRRDSREWIIDPRYTTLWELFCDVDVNGPLEAVCFGKYRILIEKMKDWRTDPIYNMGYH